MSYLFEILPSLLSGASMTLQVFALVLIFSIPLGVLIAFALQVHWKLLHYLINIYIWIMRGTPLLLQLIFIYYVLPSIGIRLDRLPAAIIAFVLNYAAYFAEIFRGGIDTIPKGQYEAAKVLKFSPFATVRYIILPQVTKIVLPISFHSKRLRRKQNCHPHLGKISVYLPYQSPSLQIQTQIYQCGPSPHP